jgi:protein phosphatase PTC6
VSQYLRQELHGVFEKVHRHDIPEVIEWVREIGGYFKRYDGGILKPWVMDGPIDEGTMEGLPPLDLASRATLAFFTADRALGLQDAHSCGATASVVMMHSLDSPQPPFFLSKKLALTVAHVG